MVEKENKINEAPASTTTNISGDAFRELLQHCTALIEAAVAKVDGRFMVRLIHHIKTLRSMLKKHDATTLPILKQSIAIYISGNNNCPVSAMALEYLPDIGTEEDDKQEGVKVPYPVAPMLGVEEFLAKNSNLGETKILMLTLALIYLIDLKKFEEAMQFAEHLAKYVLEFKSKIMDHLAAKVYFYYARAFELGGRFNQTRTFLMNVYRKACLHHEPMTEAVTFNCVVRNLVHHKLYSSAATLLMKTTFPESLSASTQYARYLYYCGNILAVQLEYSEAHNKLMQALRKAPQSDNAAFGFKLATTKMAVIVSLLMGDVPSKSTFTNPIMKRNLEPYEEVVITVMNGDLIEFSKVCGKYKTLFEKDDTMFLISRLRHNVIKGGLRKINLAYSRIPIEKVAQKLGINSVEETECIIAKAISDGIIEATIHHEEKYMESKANVNLYTSEQPMMAFNKRINFCLKLHSNAIQAMRYPDEPDITRHQTPKMVIDEEQIAAIVEEEGLGDGDML
ncbi:26S proteasome non-ATPase regulatory subunit 3 family protein [Babesia bovis T2Bo]|uniref:26S proteasome non-ATPase regulatory subunit 3 family protein n=1 Tax=Babesia bovis T2Bo TaxID=484906 RepID=UPI001C356732|nr:26S proteasome non-ATPase regulatory subunit 3 family protein [Babesia bovis T2Bo]EDO06109.2 26S proteasome non-ATPase regulatory subunit 3 family protein [Babesia bovis T2Bo]